MGQAVSSHLTLGISRRGGTTVVAVGGELDIASAPMLKDAIDRARQDDADDLVVDLRDLEFMDVSGLRVLMRAQQRADETGGRLRLANVRDSVRRLLALTGASEILSIEDLPGEQRGG
jgi:anti-sigma B factor antagonist